jgi:5-methylcytosine-specific restriction endonuclease McrA
VIICPNYSKINHKYRKPTSKNVRERDKNTCQVSGRILAPGEGNLDHTQPRSRGGENSWENLVYMDKNLNSLKGDRTIAEMGWKLLREPKPLPIIPVSATINILKHRDWKMFAKYLE